MRVYTKRFAAGLGSGRLPWRRVDWAEARKMNRD